MGVRVGVCLYDSVTDLPLSLFTIFESEADAEAFLQWWEEFQSMRNDDLRLVASERDANHLIARWKRER